MNRPAIFSLIALLMFLLPVAGFAQTGDAAPAPALRLSGVLRDTINLSPTGYASVSLINASDSVLQTFTRADDEGKFTLEAKKPGTYILLIAHPSFAIYVDAVSVDKPETSLGTIILTSKKQMLDEVVITDAKAIVIKGDTVEYNADSFQTRAYANVDELLKKLPGIEVGRDGKIKAYGKDVERMTVDGEEFFSDDPAVVAKTLRASSVDKVQVFDKKSDQAAFTGVDDGELVKTINLKLKENAKRGYFGKLSAGGGLPAYWENQAMINAFKNKRKISAFAIMSNTNTNGLDWDDQSKYGGASNSYSINDDGDFSIDGNEYMDYGDWGGQFRGQGLPKTWTGGGHYSNKWMGDSLTFSGNYKYGKNVTEGFNNSRTQYILPDTQYVNTDNTNNTTINDRHNVNTITEYQLDTSSSIKLTLGGRYIKGINSSTNYSTAAAMNGVLLNEVNTRRDYNNEDKGVNANIFYRKRFRKKGRTISANLIGDWTERNSRGLLLSGYNLYAVDSAYSLDQRKLSNSQTLTGSLKLSYTEPISEIVNLEVNYSLGLNNNDAENSSFDRNQAGGELIESFNPLFSSHYTFNATQNQGGANLRFNFKKLNFSFGGNVSDTRFRQDDKLLDTTYSYSYLNFFPRASISFRKTQTTSLSLRYNGRTRQPTISQIQPLRNNNDPLNIAVGNPDLKQEFTHNFNFSYNNYKVLSSRSIYLQMTLAVVQNAISQRQDVDISGRRSYQYVNVDGNYNSWMYGSYGMRLPFKVYARGGLSGNYSSNNNFVNGLANVNRQLGMGSFLSLSYNKDTTLDIRYQFNPSYQRNTSSIREDVKTQYWTFQQSLDASVNLPFNLEVGTSVDWNIRQRLDPQDRNNNVFRWNAYISRPFLKDRSLVARLYANDILDQNVGYSRYNSADYVSESSYNTIRRYFMLSLTWNFTKTGGAAAPSDGGMMMITE